MKNVDIIAQRYEQINDFEKYLYATGTRVVKIFLNVSKDEQARRFISRIDTQKKNWKVSPGDLKEREYWDDYMVAFEDMVNKTSTRNSPWYVVPANHKWFARLLVSRIVRKTLEDINPHYPPIEEETLKSLKDYRETLVASLGDKQLKTQEKQPKEFTNPGLISADILQQELINKQKIANDKIKNTGFKAVQKLLARNYMIHSMNDIMNAIAAEEEALEEDTTPEENEELVLTPKEVREHVKELVKEDED
jgi:hypothetical protein